MKNIIKILVLFLLQLSYSQNDGLYNEIKTYKDSTKTFISNGRNLLLDNLNNENFQKVKDIKYFLEYNIKESSNYISFFPLESALIGYWTKDYNDVIFQLNNFVRRDRNYYNDKILPDNDVLYAKIYQKSKENHVRLIDTLKNSFVRNIDKEFLEITLYKIIQDNKDTINQDFINKLSDRFIENFPNSEYDTIVRSLYRYKTKPSKIGYGIEFDLGSGNLTNGLYQQFRENPISFGLGGDLSYKNWFFSPRMLLGISKLKKDLIIDNITWGKEKQANLAIIEIPFGYHINPKDKNRIIPYLGLTLMSVEPVQVDIDKNEDLKDISVKMRAGFQAGISYDIHLKFKKTYDVFFSVNEDVNSYLRLKYNYNMFNYEKKYEGLDGNYHSFTIAISVFSRMNTRDF